MRAFNAGDAKGSAEVYDPDGYFMPNGHNPVKGRGGIQQYFQQDMADGVVSAQVTTPIFQRILFLVLNVLNLCGSRKLCDLSTLCFQIITEEVNGSGDWAFERGSYHLGMLWASLKTLISYRRKSWD